MDTARRMPRVVAVVAMTTLGLLAACSSAEDEAARSTDDTTASTGGSVNEQTDDGPGERGGRLVYGLTSETDGWNPTLSRWSPAGLIVARTIYDPLTVYDTELGWKPYLLESLVPNDDATEWVLTVRPDVTFHSGAPLDATALAQFLQYVKDSPLTAETFRFIDTFTPRGEREVVVALNEPWRTLPFALTNQIGYVADPAWLQGGDPDKPIGTGPFEFSSWERGRELVVSRNDAYWRSGYPLLDEIAFRPYEDEITRVQAFQAGDLDVAQLTTGVQLDKLRTEATTGDIQVITNHGGETAETMVMLNTKQPPLDDLEVRRAVVMAVDPQQFVDVVHQGQYDVATSPFAPGSPWYVETGYPGYRPDEAAALVEQIEARLGGPIRFTILTGTGPAGQESVQQLQSQWDAVGIEVDIQVSEVTTLIRDVVFGQYQAALWNQFEAPHPISDTIWWAPWAAPDPPEAGLNFARNDNEAIGDEIRAAARSTTREEEVEHYGTMQQLMAEDLPYVWLFHGSVALVANRDVVNLTNWATPEGDTGLPIASGAHPLHQVWLRR